MLLHEKLCDQVTILHSRTAELPQPSQSYVDIMEKKILCHYETWLK